MSPSQITGQPPSQPSAPDESEAVSTPAPGAGPLAVCPTCGDDKPIVLVSTSMSYELVDLQKLHGHVIAFVSRPMQGVRSSNMPSLLCRGCGQLGAVPGMEIRYVEEKEDEPAAEAAEPSGGEDPEGDEIEPPADVDPEATEAGLEESGASATG